MTVGVVPASSYFANATSLASGFEEGVLSDAGVANVLGVLAEPTDGLTLRENTALETLLPAYRQAAADGNRSRMQELGRLIALNIREHAATFNRLLAPRPPSEGKRFGSAEEIVAALKPHDTGEPTTTIPAEKAAEAPATVALVGAAQYLWRLRTGEGSESADYSILHRSLLEDFAPTAGMIFLMGGVFEFLLLKGVIRIPPPSTTDIYIASAVSAIFFGYSGYKFLTLRKPRQYARLDPPALYDRKTGEIMPPTLARFRQGAVPLYPVDTKEDVRDLPLGSHVLLRNIRGHVLDITNTGFSSFSFKIDLPERAGVVGILFGLYQAKTVKEAEEVKRTFQQGPVTFVGVTTMGVIGGFPDIKVVRILPEPLKTK